MRKKPPYKKPSIKTKQIKANFFYNNYRLFDSFDSLIAPNVFAQSGCGCSCFIKGTKVMMDDNSTKLIEDIKNGDIILSYNTRDNSIVKNKVEKRLIHYGYENGYIVVNNSLKVTPNHPLWLSEKKKWVRADTLSKGDQFINSDGEMTEVRSLQKYDGTFDVYNLHMKQSPHNFFAEGFLVHNQISTANNKDC